MEENTPTWFLKWWRPIMAWQYFIICMFDFLVAPILISIFTDQSAAKIIQWEPLTLRGGGLYHLSMMAIVGVTAWSRGQETINYYRAKITNPYAPNLEGYDYHQYQQNVEIQTKPNQDVNIQHLQEIPDGPEEDLSKPILIKKE